MRGSRLRLSLENRFAVPRIGQYGPRIACSNSAPSSLAPCCAQSCSLRMHPSLCSPSKSWQLACDETSLRTQERVIFLRSYASFAVFLAADSLVFAPIVLRHGWGSSTNLVVHPPLWRFDSMNIDPAALYHCGPVPPSRRPVGTIRNMSIRVFGRGSKRRTVLPSITS